MAAILDDRELQALWLNLEPNKRARALAIARVISHHGTEALKAQYAAKIKAETFPCTERDEALRLLAPNPAATWLAQTIQTHSAEFPAPVCDPVRVDVEVGRLAIALQKASEFRLWVILREMARRDRGTGKIARNALYAELEGFGVAITRDHYSRLLRRGRGIFWRFDEVTQVLYINSSRTVAPFLVEAALKKNKNLVATNLPGGKDMYISTAGSHEAFEAELYAGWMSYRGDPTISREVLETLFHRSGDTLRRWENTRLENTIQVRENYAQYEPEAGTWPDFIPDHAYPYLANTKREGLFAQVIRYRWRIPNTYKTTGIRQHPRRGQNAKVRRIVHRLLDQASGGFPRSEQSVQPTNFLGQEIEKRYFDDAKKLKRYIRKTGASERLLWRGEDKYGRGVFEPTLSYGHTRPNERVRYKEEYRHLKRMQEKIRTYVAGLLLPA